jgi:hypothetical protein
MHTKTPPDSGDFAAGGGKERSSIAPDGILSQPTNRFALGRLRMSVLRG